MMKTSGPDPWRIIIAFGIVSLLGDIVYEGARGVIPSYLKLLGLSTAAVGSLLGIAEFLAYASRIFTGYLADVSKRHRLMIFLGYASIAFLPLLALVYDRRIAILFIFLERFGKALRAPARDAIIAEVSIEIGRGKAFGIHEAMDQIGATLGPLIIALLISLYDIRLALLALLIPYAFILLFLLYAKLLHPEPGISKGRPSISYRGLYLAIFLNASSLRMPFLLLYELTGSVSLYAIPLVYLYINMIDALTALGLGKLYDNHRRIPIIGFIFAPLPALVFYYEFSFIIPRYLLSATFIGIVIAIRESVMRAFVADTAKSSLSSEFGAYYTSLGLGIAASGGIYGYLMQYSPQMIPIYSIAISLIALLAFLVELKTS